MKPYNPNIIADYIITRLTSDNATRLSNLKLQKLLYYVQAWSLGINKQPFIDADFEAWVHGPVCRIIYDRFKTTKNLYSDITSSDRLYQDFVAINQEDIEFINYILDNYAGFTGFQLETMTHSELPWQAARKDLNDFESGCSVIDKDLMKEFYGKRYQEINV